MVVQGITTGPASINISGAQVKAYSGHGEILLSVQNGSYNISVVATPTPTSVPATPIPTATPLPPTSTPLPTPLPTATPVPPTSTPIPPTSTPTPITYAPPAIDSLPSNTYLGAITLSGSRDPALVEIFVNNSTVGVTYLSSTTWDYSASLAVGTNLFIVYGKDSLNNTSGSNSVIVQRHREADISGDNIIDLTDLSIFAVDWEKTELFENPLSDINSDGIVDLTDFSILAAAYGN
jgi:hypothetical protein